MTTALKIVNLRLKFPGRPELQFKDLSLTIEQGEKVLLLGPSGCGKSTLLQVLTGLIPHSIEVPVRYDEILIPDRWGFVFQDPDTQFCMPYVDEELAFVLENLKVPHDQMPEIIDSYIQLVGLSLPDRHTAIQSLSQGMKQRLAIAGALALQPDILLLDEPTALLDPEGTEQVWETIKDIAHDKTLIIVEHKIDHIIEIVDRIILFNASGEIIADGPRTDIFNKYKDDIMHDGIWYPGVWNDYVNSPSYPRHHHEANQRLAIDIPSGVNKSSTDIHATGSRTERSNTDPSTFAHTGSPPLLQLEQFRAMRGKRCITYVETAHLFAGEWITIVGHNGAGKSTLLLALMQLIKTEGAYLLEGKPAANVPRLSDRLAFVFQNPEFQFVTNRVWDEIAYTLELDGEQDEIIAAKVEDMLQQFDLAEHGDQHPYQLSMGQKRRLSVASAVIKDQPILLLDEPTFGQDARNTFAILEKLESWRRNGSAILMVTHDLRIVEHFATKVWHVRDGSVEIYEEPIEYIRKLFTADHDQSRCSDHDEHGQVLDPSGTDDATTSSKTSTTKELMRR